MMGRHPSCGEGVDTLGVQQQTPRGLTTSLPFPTVKVVKAPETWSNLRKLSIETVWTARDIRLWDWLHFGQLGNQ